MDYSAKFAKLKSYYETGLWNENRLRNAVVKGWLSEAEFEEITGESFYGVTGSEDF